MNRHRGTKAQGHKVFFILGFSLLFPIAVEAQMARPAPMIICDESEYFFGSVTNTETVEHEFIISNEGGAPLFISAARVDCGCVLTRLADKALAPGDRTKLGVKFNLKDRSGSQARRIIVESNDPAQPRLLLYLVGEAIAPMEIKPDRIYWGNIHTAAAAEKSCEIRFHENDESYINSIIPPDPSFAAELITLKPRRIYKVIIRTVPPLRPGSFETALRLLTDHPRFRTLEIPMQGRVVADIFAIPDELVLNPSEKGRNSRALLIYSGLKKKFKILKVELPVPEIKATIRSMATGGGYRLDLRNLTPSPDLDGTSIVIFTDSETMPVLTVPISVSNADDR